MLGIEKKINFLSISFSQAVSPSQVAAWSICLLMCSFVNGVICVKSTSLNVIILVRAGEWKGKMWLEEQVHSHVIHGKPEFRKTCASVRAHCRSS